MDITDLAASVPEPDTQATEAARARQAGLAKPVGSLGRLEELAAWAAGVQGRCPPHPFDRVRVVVFAADHPAGISAYPQHATTEQVAHLLAGGGAVNVLAREAGAGVRVVDVAVAVDTAPEISAHKVRHGAGRIDREDALTPEETRAAFAAGQQIADEEVDAGADLLLTGDVGVGSSTTAATVVAALTGTEPIAVVGRGSGIDDAAWMRKVVVIRDALRRSRQRGRDPLGVLQAVGGADLAALTGLLVQAAIRRTPVLLDGLSCGAAALLARAIAPRVPRWWLAGHRSPEPAHALALSRLGLDPVLDLGVGLGAGTGALLALPVLQAAVRTLAELATYSEAGISPPTTGSAPPPPPPPAASPLS